MATIGFIGLGNMGGPMLANLLVGRTSGSAPFDLNPSALGRAVDGRCGGCRDGRRWRSTGADVVITMLPAGYPRAIGIY